MKRTLLLPATLALLFVGPGQARAAFITYTTSATLTYNSSASSGGTDLLGLNGATVTLVQTIDAGATPFQVSTLPAGDLAQYQAASNTLTISGASVAGTNGTYTVPTSNDIATFIGASSSGDAFQPGSRFVPQFLLGVDVGFIDLIFFPPGTVPLLSPGVPGLPLFANESNPGSLVFSADELNGQSVYVLSNFQASGVLTFAAAPEPASLTLFGLGSLGLAGYGWRRRKA